MTAHRTPVGRHRRSPRRPATLARYLVAGLAVLAAVVLAVPGARGAYLAKVNNSANTASTAMYFTCQAAEQGDSSISTIFEYPLGDSAGSNTAADTSTNASPATTGTYSPVAVKAGVANESPAVCPRDRTTVANFTGFSLIGGGYVAGPAAKAAAPTMFSIETWFKTTTTSGRLIGYSDSRIGASVNDDRVLYIDNSGKLAFGMLNTGVLTGSRTIASTNTVTDGVWHDAVATFSTTGMSLYLDGALQSTNATTTTRSYSGTWSLGNDYMGSYGLLNGYYTGQLAFAAAYSTVLTPELVAAHYRAGV